jgi:F0F1-type ATP synthase membrane subunit a
MINALKTGGETNEKHFSWARTGLSTRVALACLRAMMLFTKSSTQGRPKRFNFFCRTVLNFNGSAGRGDRSTGAAGQRAFR